MGYNAYTSDDDNHLIEYLSTYNPDGKGRKGNAVYKQLTENQENRWPWNKRHPWQSWRDHYVKNEKIMDRKIKVYQRKHGIAVELKDDKNDVKKVVKRASTELDHRSIRPDKASSSTHEEEQVNTKKRGRRTPSPQSHVKKQKKVVVEPVDIEHCTLMGETDGKHVVSEANNDEKYQSVPLGKRECQDISTANNGDKDGASSSNKGSQMIGQRDDDMEEYREVDQMLENASGNNTSSPSDHEHGSAARQVDNLSPRSPRPDVKMGSTEPSGSQSDGSFDSLFDAGSNELVPDSEEEADNAELDANNSCRSSEDGFFQSSPGTTTSSEADRTRYLSNKAKMITMRRRQLPVLREGPFLTTHGETTPKTYEGRNCNVDRGLGGWPPVRRKPHVPSSRNEAKDYQPEQSGRASDVNGTIEKVRENYDINGRANLPQHDEKNQLSTGVGASAECVIQLFDPVSPRRSSEIAPTETSMAAPRVSTRRQIAPSTDSAPMQGGLCHLTSQEIQNSTRHQSPVHSSVERHNRVGRSGNPAYSNNNRIDLREERKKQFSRQSMDSLNSSRSGSVLANHSSVQQTPSLSLQLSTQEQSLVTSLGIQQAIAMMSKNHGFTEDVVSRILENVNSITKADEVLRLMRIKAEEEAAKQLMVDELRDGVSASNHKRRRPSSVANKLQISELSDEDQLSDYSPPRKTRAGQFSRLAERGRRAEAYTREARRASGTVSPMKLPSISDTSNKDDGTEKALSNDNSRKSLPLEAQVGMEDDVFLDHRGERIEENTEGVQELRDAYSAATGALKRSEEGFGPQYYLRRFQQTAILLKQIQSDHQT
ncbi:hypothetical protein AX15_000327 [Amanita polypyramis BW_CC]|nr:hypothetical protein AX15_000327 [Amanita polypyramis BW_CC]